jgi:hypothetical protein
MTHRENNVVTVHRAPHEQKAYKQWRAAWFPMGIIHDTAVTNPVPHSLRHDTFHLGLGRPEPHQPAFVTVTPYRESPPHLLPLPL